MTWPGFVPCVATPQTPDVIAQMVADAWPAVIGGEAPGGCLLACLAQILLETGVRENGPPSRGYHNGNPGNVRGTYNGAWTSFTAGEGHGPTAVTLEPGPANRFRSYLSATDDASDPDVLRAACDLGIRDYLSLLARKYPRALDAAERRDYQGFVHALHEGGYFTADETAYGNAEDRLRHSVENLPQVVAFMEGATLAT